jgi:hypothetical protein
MKYRTRAIALACAVAVSPVEARAFPLGEEPVLAYAWPIVAGALVGTVTRFFLLPLIVPGIASGAAAVGPMVGPPLVGAVAGGIAGYALYR